MLPLVDLDHVFEAPWRDLRRRPALNIVVLDADGRRLGLIVGEIGDVLDVDEADLARTPETIPEAVRRLTSDLFPSAGRSLLVLNLAKVVE